MTATYLSYNFWIGVQFKQTSGELRSGGMVVGLGEKADRATQSKLNVRRLHLAMREVSGQFETSADVFRLFLDDTSLLELDRNTQQVFAAKCDGITPLLHVSKVVLSYLTTHEPLWLQNRKSQAPVAECAERFGRPSVPLVACCQKQRGTLLKAPSVPRPECALRLEELGWATTLRGSF